MDTPLNRDEAIKNLIINVEHNFTESEDVDSVMSGHSSLMRNRRRLVSYYRSSTVLGENGDRFERTPAHCKALFFVAALKKLSEGPGGRRSPLINQSTKEGEEFNQAETPRDAGDGGRAAGRRRSVPVSDVNSASTAAGRALVRVRRARPRTADPYLIADVNKYV
ncbi:hypothetical protein EVAR_21393_1 [Eumeta japonica]|uniref:Uncharacterized protein n=1 Tax=Eumeta variegata TaxID=151549 RepID=A0A4C1VFG0_EUMVA|nr:hypothetical protein EVAR_21393_1 [Eumeta japonica]